MSSPMTEYRERLKIEGIFPVNEGCLFLSNGASSIIVLTSSFTHSRQICNNCNLNLDSIILEIYELAPYPEFASNIVHTHMPSDGNILEYIRNHIPDGDKYKPYISLGDRDQERWLWEAFFKSCVTDNLIKISDVSVYKDFVDQFLYVFLKTKNGSAVIQQFYENVYSLIVARSYILVK